MSALTKVSETGFRYPYVIGWTGETQQHALQWRRHRDGETLAYLSHRPSDYAYGVLRLRQGQTMRGRPDFKTVNTRRQWRCMDKRLCQVCGKSAVDRETGRIWWLLSASEGEAAGDGFTNAPPTCPACIPEAISQCSYLRRNAAVFTVGGYWPYGVRADVFSSCLPPIVPYERNTVVRFDDHDIRNCIARELLVRLHDVQPAVTEGDVPRVA